MTNGWLLVVFCESYQEIKIFYRQSDNPLELMSLDDKIKILIIPIVKEEWVNGNSFKRYCCVFIIFLYI